MALVNYATNEITAKLVYYGPGLCGKTTNLQWIHENVGFKAKTKLLQLATEADRTLFFDFLPAELGTIRGMNARVHIYTVPGQIYYAATRRLVLKGADAVVFVADSQRSMLDADVESLENLQENLVVNGLSPTLPMVLQYNKRDLHGVLPVSVLNARLNPRGVPFHEAVAINGTGVAETLRSVLKLLFNALSESFEKAPPPMAPSADATPARPPQEPIEVEPVAPPSAGAMSTRPQEPIEVEPVAPPSADAKAPQEPIEVEPVTTPPAPVVRPPLPAVVQAETTPARREPEPFPADLGPDQWVYLLGGERRGPVEFDDLVDLVLTSIPEDTQVWRTGMTRWTPANLVPEIAEHIPPPLSLAGAVGEEDFPEFDTIPAMLRTALIADEDASFRRRLALPLAAQGFKIYEASDGAEAWSLATRHHPWLMLADISTPEVDGFEFCRRVRANSLLSHRPLVFVSGSDRYKERYRAMQLGADDFLSKLTPIRELLIRIQLLLTRYSDLGLTAAKQAGAEEAAGAFEGLIETFGAPGVLQICSQGRLSGMFTARAARSQAEPGRGKRVAVFGFRNGEIITAVAQDLTGVAAVYDFLSWNHGQFKFVPGDPGTGAPLAETVEHLLLEGCRRLDESRQASAGPASAG